MKVFVSWSGKRSRHLADGIRQLIGDVIQTAEPFMSAHHLEPGERWADRLDQELLSTFFGVVCLTPENLNSTWIHYECGALRKAVEKSRVCPVLFDIDNATEVAGPLLQFQSTKINREGLHRVLTTINRSMDSARRITEEQLDRTFDKFWGDFQTTTLDTVPALDDEVRVDRPDRDLLEEMLLLLRQLPKQLSVPSQDVIQDFRMRVREFDTGGFDLGRGRALGGQVHEYFLQFGDDESNITHYDQLSALGARLLRATSCDEAVPAVSELAETFDEIFGNSDYYGSSGY